MTTDSSQYTTAGSIQIKHLLPTQASRDAYDLYKPLDKGQVSKLMNNLVQNGGDNYHGTISTLTNKFFDKATEIGATTNLSDYDNNSNERAVILAEFEKKVSDVMSKNLPKMEQAQALADVAAPLQDRLTKSNLTYLLSRGSTAAKMALTGARGNPAQLLQGTASPMMAKDVNNMPIPVAIKHSFAEGLSSAEHLAMSYGGRASTVMAQLSTALPGALFKQLTPALFHEVITTPDCGTKNGVMIPVKDKFSLLGRYQAVTNKLIDEAFIHELEMSGVDKVLARNPMTCEARHGMCQKCYGLTADSKDPHIGKNVGVIAAQSVSEVLTQAVLSIKHGGGTVGKRRNAYEEASNLLRNPKANFQDEATISSENGPVTNIRKTALNDHEITVGGKIHFVNRIQTPTVKVGDVMQVGDPMSTGTVNPRELVSLKGSGAGRVYLADALRSVYSTSSKLDPRHFDVIARNMVKHSKITNGGESGFNPGEIVDFGQLSQHLNEHSQETSLSSAKPGDMLACSTLELTPGTTLTQNHLDYLKKNKVNSLHLSTDKELKMEAVVPGLQTNKLLDSNWVSKLAFSQLSKTIQEAAVKGESSPIHSTDPIASYMMGNEFGEGEHGNY